jgi:hypothetical protein
VQDVIRAHPENGEAWSAWFRSARLAEPRWQDGVCSVAAELELAGLWDLIAGLGG